MGSLKNKSNKPAGFQRPAVSLGNGGIREWRNAAAAELSEGDTIAGSGVVKIVMQTCGPEYYVLAGEDNELFLSPDETVFAFVRKDS